jgi:hypothetical protein
MSFNESNTSQQTILNDTTSLAGGAELARRSSP